MTVHRRVQPMRSYVKPPKEINIRLPKGFSTRFLSELQSAIDFEDKGFKGRYLQENLLSKYCDSKTTSAALRKSRAISKWLDSERRNEITNERLFRGDAYFHWCGDFPDFVCQVQSLISRILGPVRYPDILMDIVHTNGASTRVSRHENAAALKLEGNAHVSSDALKHWFQAAKNTRLSSQNLDIVESSALFTVPKRSDIDRVACKEPEINMLLQRSVGKHIRRRLKHVGVDLRDQSINQRLAAEAVSSGLATIDLSSASDSISRQLVLLMLPWDWYSLLDDLRVKSTLVDGKLHQLEMFSSMGNGFTFELESLLFYAITRVVCRISGVKGRISVYGDDIIAPNKIVPRLIKMFLYLGFRTNDKKTFWTGDFRESCGYHYYRGRDVSPFFVRREVSTLPDLINILNGLMEWETRDVGFFEDQKLLEFHHKYSLLVPPYLWGGSDPGENSRLVTGHAPRYRLVAEQRDMARPENAAMTHWFMAREGTPDENPFSVEPEVRVRWKAKRASKGWTASWRPWFLKE